MMCRTWSVTLIVSLLAFLVLSMLAVGGALAAAGDTTVAGPVSCPAAAAPARQEVGKVHSYHSASPSPMLAGWKDTIASPGAEFVRVHFVDFDLGPGEELVVSNPDGSQSWAYSGRGVNGDGDFWSFAVDGDSVKLEVRNATGKGSYRIVEIGHGTVSLKAPSFTPEVVCGTDGRENIACRTGDAIINNAQKPVARLLFTSGRSQYLCTGELIAGSNANTMITNNHCFSTQKEVNTVQAKFNYQYTTCAGGTLAATTDYAGGALLKTNAERYNRKQPSGLDYTLFTLQGNPESTWGELAATTKAPVIGQLINFIQHPGGNHKKIGYWEDAAHTVRCKIDTVNMKYGNAAPGSQAGYGCDSEGGSSGSAITDAATGRVVALHHYGGVASVPCLNSGTLMSKICADAGSLLSCVSN